MDIHKIPGGITAEDVAKCHAEDIKVQSKYGVSYHKYWVNEKEGKIFCLCHAPNAEAAVQVHREAHGQMAEKIIQVEPEVADLFFSGTEVNAAGAVILPDIVDSTSLTRRLGDEAAMELLAAHDSIVRDALVDLGGREIKHLGDGIMASFVSAASAVKCATRIQREIARHGKERKDRALSLRLGIAAGEPVERHNDLFGVTVQLAARLCSHAQPQQILVSNVVAELCEGKALPFEDLGEVALKGFDQPVRARAVIWTDEVASV